MPKKKKLRNKRGVAYGSQRSGLAPYSKGKERGDFRAIYDRTELREHKDGGLFYAHLFLNVYDMKTKGLVADHLWVYSLTHEQMSILSKQTEYMFNAKAWLYDKGYNNRAIGFKNRREYTVYDLRNFRAR